MLRAKLRMATTSTLRSSLSRWNATRPPGRRRMASVTNLNNYPACGEKIHGFTLQAAKQFPELELTALQFQHDRTGAEYIHVARDDKNNVFSIGFKTNPPDNTGVPHILEHTTLCGSQKLVLAYRSRVQTNKAQVPCPRPFLQNATALPLQLYECLHILRSYFVSFCNYESARLP